MTKRTIELRGIGYLDYIGSTRQFTPLFWFNPLPSWTKLSLHDHPPHSGGW